MIKKNDIMRSPPPVFRDMEGEFLEYREGDSLTVKFPVKERYQNPMGVMQGGMILAAVDNVFGCLSYLISPESVTTHLNSTFLRPVTREEPFIYITASVLEKTRSQIHMEAKVVDSRERVLVFSTASFRIMK